MPPSPVSPNPHSHRVKGVLVSLQWEKLGDSEGESLARNHTAACQMASLESAAGSLTRRAALPQCSQTQAGAGDFVRGWRRLQRYGFT